MRGARASIHTTMAGRKPIPPVATGWNKGTLIQHPRMSPAPNRGVTEGMLVSRAFFHLEITHRF